MVCNERAAERAAVLECEARKSELASLERNIACPSGRVYDLLKRKLGLLYECVNLVGTNGLNDDETLPISARPVSASVVV